MRDMNVQHHLVVDEVAVTADVTAADEIDPENEDDPEAMIVEEVDHVADQIGKICHRQIFWAGFQGQISLLFLDEAVIEAEKEEVDPIVDQIVIDQIVVAVTTDLHPNPGKWSWDQDRWK